TKRWVSQVEESKSLNNSHVTSFEKDGRTLKMSSMTTKIPRPHPLPLIITNHPLDIRSMRNSRDKKMLKRIHVKRQCARGSNGPCVLDDFKINSMPTWNTSAKKSSNGNQNEHNVENTKKDVCDLKVSSTNGFNEEVVSYMPKSSQFEKNDDKPFLESSTKLLPKEDSSLPFVIPRTLKVVSTGVSGKEDIETLGQSMHMNDANRNFYPSLESLYFPFGPQHCQRTWEFDTFTLESISNSGYEVHEGHSLEENDKENMHFTSFWWKSNAKGFQQMHPMFKSGTITSKLKPNDNTSISKRSNNTPILKRHMDGTNSELNMRQTRSATNGKTKNSVATKASLKRLACPRTALYQQCAQTKALLEEKKMSECSFKPIVGRRPNPYSFFSTPIIDHNREMKQRIEFRKRARKVIEKEELDQCSFTPQINFNSMYLDLDTYQPIQKRLQQLMRKRIERIAHARAQETKTYTFKPEINQNSIRLFKQKGLETIDVANRLTSYNTTHFDHLGECRGKLYTPKNECTFSPKINPNTDEILAGSEFEGCDFLSRQELFVRKFKQHKKMKKFQYPNIFTFQPKIGNASIILQYSPLQEGNRETTCERLERLSYQDNVRRHHIRQRISDNYYAQFKFQPEIDQTSNELVVGASTHYELHKNEKGKKTKQTLEQAAYQEFMQKCTFHPEVNVHKSHHNLEQILQNRRKFRKQKTKSIEQLQAERELEEFKECTFKPIVHVVPPKPMEPIVIKGLGRHLELQDLAKQMKKDHEEWEHKVFFSHVKVSSPFFTPHWCLGRYV
ncbi:unnamed protein product, partial [Sphagnum compactum]